MNKKKYSLSYEWWECVVEIDHEHPKLEEALKIQVEFWTDWELRLDKYDRDYLRTYLSMLGNELLRESMNNLNVYGLQQEFRQKEGWAPLDGCVGITLISCDNYSFNDDDIRIESVE